MSVPKRVVRQDEPAYRHEGIDEVEVRAILALVRIYEHKFVFVICDL